MTSPLKRPKTPINQQTNKQKDWEAECGVDVRIMWCGRRDCDFEGRDSLREASHY